MKNRILKLGVVNPKLKIADVDYNTKQIIDVIKNNQDCNLLVFPELSITGYTCADLFQQEFLQSKAIDSLFQIAKATAAIDGVVIVGLPLRYENKLYNVGAMISQGKVCGIVPKGYLPTYGEFYESRWFASGRAIEHQTIYLHGQQIPFGVDILGYDEKLNICFGIEICEDLWVPNRPSIHQCMAGATIIANLSASNEMIGKQAYRRNMVVQQSGNCYCAYLYASSGIFESSTDLVYSGHLMIANCGSLLAESIFDVDTKVVKTYVDLDLIEYNRIHQSTYENTEKAYRKIPVCFKQEIDCTITEFIQQFDHSSLAINPFPFVPSNLSERQQRCQDILKIQAMGLATRILHTGIKKLVIGISGGLDSTLALLVCNEVRKMIPDVSIIAYTMPNQGNTTTYTYQNAIALMKHLNTQMHEVEIFDGVKEHLLQIGHPGVYQGESDITYENAQARMRTYILMDVANKVGGLVVGTGDLSELALGWCTYNGDHMSMYAVNSSIPKTLVKYICETYANTCGDETLKTILLRIVDTPISPELIPNQNDKIVQKTEEKIGKYDLNDFFLYYVLRYGMNPEKLVAYTKLAFPDLEILQIKENLIRFYKRFFTQQFKRSCLPDGPKVGSVSLSPRGDWRMPSDASYQSWVTALENIK